MPGDSAHKRRMKRAGGSRRRARDAASVQEAATGWLRPILELPFIGVAVFERGSGRWTHFNDRFCSLVGYTRAELGALAWTDLCHPDDRAECETAFRRLAASPGTHVRMIHRLRRKDGTLVHLEIDISHAPRRHGGPDRIVALASDVAGRQTEASLARYGTVFAEGQSPMVILDAETGGVVDANPAAQSFYGWTVEEMRSLGMHLWDISETDPVLVRGKLRDAATGAVTHAQGTHRLASGERRSVEVYCGPVDLGGRRCVYGIVRDVTERRRAEEARREAEETLHAVVEQSIVGIYILEDGKFRYANRRMCEIFGYADGELAGRPTLDVVAPADRDAVAERQRRRFAGEVESLQFEFRGLRRDGVLIDVGAHGNAVLLHGKRVIIGVAQDITERRRESRRAEEFHAKTEAAMRGAVGALSRMVDLRDPYTAGHERRVAGLSGALARRLGMGDDEVRSIEIAAQVHDIGKISVPSEILAKPARLSRAEFEIVKLHAPNGYDILKTVDFPWPVADMAAQHHERLDGSGYPKGLRDRDVVPGARVLAVADVIEAMSSHRPYRAALGTEPALAEIERGAGSVYDADVASRALRLFRDEGFRIPD